MVITPEVFTDNIPLSCGPYITVKQTNANKLFGQFSETLDIKTKTAVHRLGAA